MATSPAERKVEGVGWCRRLSRWEGGGHLLRPGFRALGSWIGRRPLRTIFFSSLFTFACSLGLLKLEVSYGYKMWYDSSAPSYEQWELIEQHWPNLYDEATAIFAVPTDSGSGGEGVLAPGCLAEASRIRQDMLKSLPASACGQSEGVCEDTLFRSLEVEGGTLNDAAGFLSEKRSSNGGVLPFTYGRIVGDDCCGLNITGASALKLRFHHLLKDRKDADTFQQDFVQTCKAWEPSPASKLSCPQFEKVACSTSVSYMYEQKEAMDADQNFMMTGVVLMIVYVAAALGRTCDCLHSKILLGASVIASVFFSLAISFGLGALMGWPFTQMSMLAIFILLGVGIDDAFVISDCFHRTDASRPPEERLADTLGEAGPSVFLTSVTDLVAFLVGVTYTVDAIKFFCLNAAIAVFAVFFTQITFFAALLVLDLRRVEAGRCDCCPCVPAFRSRAPPESDTDVVAMPQKASPDSTELPWGEQASRTKAEPSYIRLLNACFRPPIMAATIFAFAALLGVSTYLVNTEMRKGNLWSDHISADSYLLDYWEADELYFGRTKPMGIFANPIDLNRPEELQAVQEVVDDLGSLSIAVRPRQMTWVDAFRKWRGAGDAGVPGALLQGFLSSTEGGRYRSDIVSFPGGGADVVIARAWVWCLVLDDPASKLDAMLKVRSAYADAMQGRVPGFVWASIFIESDRYDSIDGVIVRSLGLALAGIALVCFLLLPPVAAIASLLSISFVNVDIMGFVGLWGVNMSVSMAAILVLALGFSVDYSAHVAEGFCVRLRKQPSDPAAAMVETLRTTGVSVLHGGASTFLAVLMLAFSATGGFVDMFKCFFLMVVFGLLHGLVLLPVLLVVFANFSLWCSSSTEANHTKVVVTAASSQKGSSQDDPITSPAKLTA